MVRDRQPNARLEALRDERDHLRIQLSLLLESDPSDPRQLEFLTRRLTDLDAKIHRFNAEEKWP